MPGQSDRDPERLRTILLLASRIRADLSSLDRQAFMIDQNAIDVTAFRLASIGECANKLPSQLKARHPTVDWTGAYRLRNIVMHDYGAIDAALIWSVAGAPLDKMVAVCRAELAEFDL